MMHRPWLSSIALKEIQIRRNSTTPNPLLKKWRGLKNPPLFLRGGLGGVNGFNQSLMRCWLVFALCCCLVPTIVIGENRLRIYELKHSFAAPVLEMIRPHLPSGTGASAHDNKLLLNISDEDFARIEPLLQQLDAAPIRVMVSVRQRQQHHQKDQGVQADVNLSNQGSDVRVRGQYSTSRDNENATQKIQTLSGQAAFLQTGYEIPYLTISASPLTGTISTGTQFRAVGTGFYVLPRVNGDSVTLLINPRQESALRNGQIRSNVIETQVSGRISEWLELGGSTQQQHSYSTQRQNSWQVELRVDVLP